MLEVSNDIEDENEEVLSESVSEKEGILEETIKEAVKVDKEEPENQLDLFDFFVSR